MADLDAGEEIEDPFNRLLPLPYKLSVVLVFGIWLWGLNVNVLHQYRIDISSLIRSSPINAADVFRYASTLSAPLVACIIIWKAYTYHGDILPNATLIAVLLIMFAVPHRFLYPTSFWPAAGRSRFLATFRRIALGGLARSEDGKFGDVLLADALTSYARPLSELYIALTMMWRRQGTDSVDRSSMVAVPLLLAVPFAIRLRQCITDNQPYNALKYATAFPAILFSTLLRAESLGAWRGLIGYLWILAALTNALYSFYWDVTCDWDLTLLTKPVGDHPYGLRAKRNFSDNAYYSMIALDLVLRFAWAFKLSPHLEHFYDIEGGIFILELLEVVRRFLWVYFRVETEWVRTKHSSDVLLGDVGPKLDED
ncbi:EXS-domain-containing protein [Hortaea werneckii]|uniref:EXS domain-containing protein n=1 Tax=Hortaea werneckii TaxID=91943 RepID=A0A3M7C2X1_HORWE|nr:EXS-domain-containing protein [Hortaea werneckii]KAI7370901.1 EXS-domain-containing protein [Hortaea werneckii]KAI7542086.1 EXS-domain-containing protein [Hortaea werneckii]KAI7715143.1 EXS-domain-containing protein [Hortaea werneckii]RMY46130.1 hypothetical protein D0865_09474 [Hortaea werneckii]